MSEAVEWRKSRRSNTQGGECVEVSTNVAGVTLIRDSRDPEGPRIALGGAELAAFLKALKAADV